MTSKLHQTLARASPILFISGAGIAGFAAYFSMYAFRKPFSVALFSDVPGWHFALDYKIAVVLAQVLGYAVSKLLGVIIVVRDNTKALLVIHGVVIAGLLLLGVSTLAFQAGLLSPLVWMILSGAGPYMAYVPFNAMLFDRLIAASATVGTAGFLIYVADASGYLGSCARSRGIQRRPGAGAQNPAGYAAMLCARRLTI